MKFQVILLAFLANEVFAGNVISFTKINFIWLLKLTIQSTGNPGLEWIESDRSDEFRVKFTLPNGYSDVMVLERYFFNEDERLNRIEKCNFIGHLESDKKAGVALTGCLGQEDVMTTILFQNEFGGSTIIWKIDGEIMELGTLDENSSSEEKIIFDRADEELTLDEAKRKCFYDNQGRIDLMPQNLTLELTVRIK